MAELVLLKPLGHQVPQLESPYRFKLWREGRRVGKSRKEFIGAVEGHGDRSGVRSKDWWPGFLEDGGWVYWVSRDYTQLKTLWREEFRPRFQGVHPQVWTSDQEFRIEMRAPTANGRPGGFFQMLSAENIDSARGKKADLILVDEGAHFDLEYAWQKVLLPMLIDRGGSAIFASTTDMGSYFNELCEAEIAGDEEVLGDASLWEQVHTRTRDAPHLNEEDVKLIYSMYPEGSPERAQELDAELVAAGGLAFPMWKDEVHAVKVTVPEDAEWYWTVDFGFQDHGWAAAGALWGEGRFHFKAELSFRETDPKTLAAMMVTKFAKFPDPQCIVYDAQMDAASEGFVSVLDRFRHGLDEEMGAYRPGLQKGPKGPGSRWQRRMLISELLGYTALEDGTIPEWLSPRLTFEPDGCPIAIREFKRLKLDQKDVEKVADNQHDHPFDGSGYLLMFVTPEAKRPPRHRSQMGKNRGRMLNRAGTVLLKRPAFEPYEEDEDTYVNPYLAG